MLLHIPGPVQVDWSIDAGAVAFSVPASEDYAKHHGMYRINKEVRIVKPKGGIVQGHTFTLHPLTNQVKNQFVLHLFLLLGEFSLFFAELFCVVLYGKFLWKKCCLFYYALIAQHIHSTFL